MTTLIESIKQKSSVFSNIHLRKSLSIFLIFFIQTSFAMEQQMPPAQVSVVLASERLLAPTIQVSGSVISLNDANISTQVSGELEWIAEVGTQIQEGESIARIVPTIMTINLQSAEAQMNKLKADLKFREQEVKRFKILANQDNTSKARLQEESSKRDMLLQDIHAATADVKRAKYYLSQTDIKAPFSGHVVSRLASKGEFLSVGNKLIRLVDTFNREVTINTPLELLPYLKKDLQLEVASATGTQNLPIKAIVPVGDNVSRMIEVRLSISGKQLITGMPVTVSVPKAEALNRVTIPRDALIIKGSDVIIYRIDDSMKSERIDAEITAIDGPWVAISHKLEAGDKIVVRGGERLMPGQAVSILDN